MSEDSELEDLQALIASAGFARLSAFVEQSWGAEACLDKIDRALQELKPGDSRAEKQTVLQIRAAARQIHGLLRWPTQRISELQAAREKPSAMQMLRRITR